MRFVVQLIPDIAVGISSVVIAGTFFAWAIRGRRFLGQFRLIILWLLGCMVLFDGAGSSIGGALQLSDVVSFMNLGTCLFSVPLAVMFCLPSVHRWYLYDSADHGDDADLQMIVDTAINAFVAMNEEGKIVRWNTSAERMFGWTKTEAIGRQLAELLIPVAKREEHFKGLRDFLVTGYGALMGRTVEQTAIRKDGEEFTIEMSVSPLRTNGCWVFNAFIADISHRKRNEANKQTLASAITNELDNLKRRAETAVQKRDVVDVINRLKGLVKRS